MLDLSYEMFFDRIGINDILTKTQIRGLSKYGAFVRRNAKSRVRKRKRISEPGKSPSSHIGLLRDFILFFYDRTTSSVVIGPKLLNSKQRAGNRPQTSVLEFGGSEFNPATGKIMEYKARPYMAPADKEERPKFASMFIDEFRK